MRDFLMGPADVFRRNPHRLRPQIARGVAAVTTLDDLPKVDGGGMHVNAARLWALLLAVQNAAGISGDTCEIGVFRGYGSLVPSILKGDSDDCWLVDVSEHFLESAATLLQETGGADPDRIHRLHGDSGVFVKRYPEMSPGRKVRWAHIDGEHSREAVIRDLDNLLPSLSREAILVVDDFSHPLAPSIRFAVLEWLSRNPSLRLLIEGYNKAYLVQWESALPWDAIVERLPDFFERFFSQRVMLASQTPSDRTPYWAYGDPINEDSYLRVGGTLPDWKSFSGYDVPAVLVGERAKPEFMVFGNCQMRVLAGALNSMTQELGMHARFRYVNDVQDLSEQQADQIRDSMPNCVGLVTQPVSNPGYRVTSAELEQLSGGDLVFRVPSMHMAGYWPNQADLRLSSASSASQPTDALIYSAVMAGWEFEYLAELLGSSELYSEEQVLAWWQSSLDRLAWRRDADQLHVDLVDSITRATTSAPSTRLFYTFNHPGKLVFDDVLRQLLGHLTEWLACREVDVCDAVISGSPTMDFPMSSIDFLDIPPLPSVMSALHLADVWSPAVYSSIRPRGSGVTHTVTSLRAVFDGISDAYSQLDEATRSHNIAQVRDTALLPTPFADAVLDSR